MRCLIEVPKMHFWFAGCIYLMVTSLLIVVLKLDTTLLSFFPRGTSRYWKNWLGKIAFLKDARYIFAYVCFCCVICKLFYFGEKIWKIEMVFFMTELKMFKSLFLFCYCFYRLSVSCSELLKDACSCEKFSNVVTTKLSLIVFVTARVSLARWPELVLSFNFSKWPNRSTASFWTLPLTQQCNFALLYYFPLLLHIVNAVDIRYERCILLLFLVLISSLRSVVLTTPA